VQDNGSGITPENYETIALKHHTSKLSTYSDLSTLQTYGFRGEALSSLCALSHFTITTCLASDAPKGTKLDFENSGKLKGTSIVAAQKGTTVVVENLFHNLPVRRRELERNIKREWNRVVGLLGQYACIQTGVKISATQQASRGKKTTLFSTKGNPSTRENIVNVFGAKTLTALLALDLKLELEPTSGSSQRWSTQEDGSTKEVRIVGYISRPAFGEGRQTPDRQMFFVNARPCGLPQVAKAFNEVYKSYNSTQSPFIFANIEIDTHLYDVNVSPDKRTILLHDQTSMLEHLKTSLTELFESQVYTVPISQLPTQRKSTYRQLTITGQNAIPKDTSHASAESTEYEEQLESRSRPASTDQSVNEEGPRKSRNPQVRQNAVSPDSMSRDQEAVSLISNWLSRKTEERSAQKEPNAKDSGKKADGLSKEKLRLVEKLGKANNQADTAPDASGESEWSVDDLPPIQEKSRQVLDFNQRIAELDPRNTPKLDKASVQIEDPIPAITTPARRSVASVKGISSGSAQPFRSPATVATITIGDRTVTSSIGSPSPKRPRIKKSANTDGHSPLPSFGSRLTQRFAAPGTTQSTETSDDSGARDVDKSEKSPLGEEDQLVAAKPAKDPQEEQVIEIEAPVHDSSLLTPEENLDGDYIDEDGKRALEEAKVLEMIRVAEEEATRPSDDSVKRARLLLKGSTKRKDSTIQLIHSVNTTVERIQTNLRGLNQALSVYCAQKDERDVPEEDLDSETAEEKLSLTINKSDFEKMKVVGQFNLGFILASRTGTTGDIESEEQHASDDLFIIDQHASDEKYNFERLQSTTIVQSQRLVRPKTLDLTAVEEEIVIENRAALETNGFVVNVDESGDVPVGQRCQLISLPLSRETTFSLSDLEELLSLLSEHPAGSVPRPSKVRKMFAMRACRSSIMIGRTLTHQQMGKVIRHMGQLDKPWNCPHGRPTMRHLFKLDAWDEVAWKEGDGIDGERASVTDWAGYVRQKRGLEA
jgi:DNA mismatch repair protein PMS2